MIFLNKTSFPLNYPHCHLVQEAGLLGFLKKNETASFKGAEFQHVSSIQSSKKRKKIAEHFSSIFNSQQKLSSTLQPADHNSQRCEISIAKKDLFTDQKESLLLSQVLGTEEVFLFPFNKHINYTETRVCLGT